MHLKPHKDHAFIYCALPENLTLPLPYIIFGLYLEMVFMGMA